MTEAPGGMDVGGFVVFGEVMSYSGAEQKATRAASLARNAGASLDDQGDRFLAQAVEQLSRAVAELAGSLHRDS